MISFAEHLLSEKTNTKVEKLVSFLKIKGYGDISIIKVLDGLGNNTNPQMKQLHTALKNAKVKDQDITGAAAAMNEESE